MSLKHIPIIFWSGLWRPSLFRHQRKLERTFKRYTGVTPAHYYINLRLELARHLLTQTKLPIVELASGCGFKSHENFTKAYKKRFQILPKVHRFEGRIPFQFRKATNHECFYK